jgi:hypothetical protein
VKAAVTLPKTNLPSLATLPLRISKDSAAACLAAALALLPAHHSVLLLLEGQSLGPLEQVVSAHKQLVGPLKEGMSVPLQANCACAYEHMEAYGTMVYQFGLVATKNYSNGASNPKPLRQKLTISDVMKSDMLGVPLTKFMTAEPCQGACAVLLVSDSFTPRKQLIQIRAFTQAENTQPKSIFGLTGFEAAQSTLKPVLGDAPLKEVALM